MVSRVSTLGRDIPFSDIFSLGRPRRDAVTLDKALHKVMGDTEGDVSGEEQAPPGWPPQLDPKTSRAPRRRRRTFLGDSRRILVADMLLKSREKLLQRRPWQCWRVSERASRNAQLTGLWPSKDKTEVALLPASRSRTTLFNVEVGSTVCTHGTVGTPPHGVAYSISSLPFSGCLHATCSQPRPPLGLPWCCWEITSQYPGLKYSLL